MLYSSLFLSSLPQKIFCRFNKDQKYDAYNIPQQVENNDDDNFFLIRLLILVMKMMLIVIKVMTQGLNILTTRAMAMVIIIKKILVTMRRI